jgi:hypothetical protein
MFLPSAYSDAQSGAIGTSSWGCNDSDSPIVALIRINPDGHAGGRTQEGIRHGWIWCRRAKTKEGRRSKSGCFARATWLSWWLSWRSAAAKSAIGVIPH